MSMRQKVLSINPYHGKSRRGGEGQGDVHPIPTDRRGHSEVSGSFKISGPCLPFGSSRRVGDQLGIERRGGSTEIIRVSSEEHPGELPGEPRQDRIRLARNNC